MRALQEIVDAFDTLAPEDRLPWLIEFGNSLLPLPEALHPLRNAGEYLVHECQAPVFLKMSGDEDQMTIHADVPREAPIARGFVALLQQVFDGSPVTDLKAAPEDLLAALQIRSLLGMQRQIGLTAIYTSLKKQMPGD